MQKATEHKLLELMLWEPDGFPVDTFPLGHFPLPPTSSEIGGHVQRGAFLVRRAWQLHVLATANKHEARLQPLQHGCEDFFGALLHFKCLNPFPRTLSTVCKVCRQVRHSML